MSVEFAVSAVRTTIKAGTPLLMGTLGEIYTERSGVLNLGVEGMMIMGAITAFSVTANTNDPWLGVVLAAMVGGVFSLIHAFTSITLRANQIVSGLALTMLGLGLSGLLGKPYVGMTIKRIKETQLPFIGDIPVLGPMLFRHDPLVYISMALVPFMWFILFKTKAGINIRSVGENPAAADSLGVNVFMTRYICVFVGGVLSGLAGAYLSVVYTPAWIEGMTAGRGWIVIALTIFSMWSPTRALMGAYLFGGVSAIQFNLQPLGVSVNILNMLPYIATVVALLVGTRETVRKRIGAPSALGLPYSREEK